METIVSALKEEQKEAEALIKKYENELKKLPIGSFFVRTIKKKQYGYVTKSVDGEVKQEYLGTLSEKQQKKWQEKYDRSKRLKALLKQAKVQYDFLRKALRHAQQKSNRSS